jgi:hypothetical protein
MKKKVVKDRHFPALDLGAESGRAIIRIIVNGTLSLSETNRFAIHPLFHLWVGCSFL